MGKNYRPGLTKKKRRNPVNQTELRCFEKPCLFLNGSWKTNKWKLDIGWLNSLTKTNVVSVLDAGLLEIHPRYTNTPLSINASHPRSLFKSGTGIGKSTQSDVKSITAQDHILQEIRKHHLRRNVNRQRIEDYHWGYNIKFAVIFFCNSLIISLVIVPFTQLASIEYTFLKSCIQSISYQQYYLSIVQLSERDTEYTYIIALLNSRIMYSLQSDPI